ncbi:MAG: ABC transporter ATP-binding protein [Frankiaceae bacterium]|nr:ABC transporter ATP-binding protein [Arenimonas sp.]
MAAAHSSHVLLDVCGLNVSFNSPDGVVEAVRGMSFKLEQGRTLGIVGESGSGKSVSTQSIVGLVHGARISGHARFDGHDLLTMTKPQLRAIRGPGIAMIFQNPMSSLHPLYPIGWQISEMIRAHEPTSRSQARQRAIELLGQVGIPRPDVRVDDYPHQYSGGMLQRAMIAMAIALNPRVLIADEPTTALDVTVQAQILRLLRHIQEQFGTAIIMITHDLGVVSEIAHDVMVMYAGRAMEQASRETLLRRPRHPYTQGLLRSRPQPGALGNPLTPIPGQPPSLIGGARGCPFQPRCTQAISRCAVDMPPLTALRADGNDPHRSACWLTQAEEAS